MLSYNDSPVIGEMIDTPAADVPHPDILVFPVLTQTLLGSIPLDAMRNNSSKLVNQNMDVAPLEENMIFLWLMAAMPIAMMSVIWAVNELIAWLGKKKSKSRW